MNNLIIEGFIGSGKGSVARITGKKLKLPVVDIDRLISEKVKMTTADASLDERCVIVLGSGVAMMPQNKEYLEKLGTVYYIKLKQQTILSNMKESKKHNWIRTENWDEQVAKLYKEREPAYRKTADVVISADGKTPEQIADEIIAHQEG